MYISHSANLCYDFILSGLKPHNNEGHFNIFTFLIHNHNFDNEVLGVRRNRLLTDGLDELAELHGKTLLALPVIIS